MALERGITPEDFWGSSVLEVSDQIEAFENARITALKDEILLQFNTATVIANRIARIFADPKKHIRMLYEWDLYPDLFEDRSVELEEQKQMQETQEFKRGLYAFAERWNKGNQQ